MTSAFASAADTRYGYHLLNLVGSVKANSDVFDRIVVHDLGLLSRQRELLEAVPGVEVRTVPAFAPHWAHGFTWKPWIWTSLDADLTFYLDAGATVLRTLEPALAQVEERGYFVVSQGGRLRDIVPSDYFDLYRLAPSSGERPYVAAGIIGFRRNHAFFERVISPTYEDCFRGRNLGRLADPPIRDCRHLRGDQTLLNIHLVRGFPDAFVNDLHEYGGWRSPRDHPNQVIWNHRRRGSLRYLKRIRYTGRGALRARAYGALLQWRWWLKLHDRFLRPSTYLWKLRKIKAGLAAGPRER
jgi:hypothetical protein